jgi:proteic killer suppression protein
VERFGNDGTRDVYNGTSSKAARRTVSTTALNVARRKLLQVVAATKLADLAVPPANKLENHKESGRYNSYHSIRVNDQYRVLFRWTDAGAMNIVIDDYHN